MDSKAEALGALRKRVTTLQMQMTDKILKMAAEIEKLLELVPAREAKEFLRVTCNLPSAELATYVGFASKLKDHEEVLRNTRASFPVVKALVAADEDVRGEILARMDIGARIDTQEIAAVRKRLREARLTPAQVIADRNVRTVRRAARNRSLAASGAFQAKVASLANDLLGAGPKGMAYAADSLEVRAEAAALREECLSLFGDEGVALSGRKPEPFLGLAYEALRRVSEGRFGGASHYCDELVLQSDSSLVASLRKLAGLPMSGGIWNGAQQTISNLPPPPFRLKALELCAGAGGMSLGLERAGFMHAALFELDSRAAATLRRNRPDWNIVEGDIRDIDFRRYRHQRIGLVAGGLPCQPYSADGNGLGKDDPRDLLLEAVRIVGQVKPQAFMFENVTGLLQTRHADHLANVLRGFRKAGYNTEIHRIEASDFGIAQERTRILLIGLRKGLAGALRMPSASPERRANIGDVLADLMAENGWTGAAQWVRDRRNHPVLDRNGNIVARGAQASTIVTSQGKRRKNAHASWDDKGIDMSKLPLRAPTAEEGGVDGFRPGLTARMRARLQNFPDDWVFVGGKAAVMQQIGNAVPPRIAQAAGLALFGAIRNLSIDWEAMLWPTNTGARVALEAPPLETDLGLAHVVSPAVLEPS